MTGYYLGYRTQTTSFGYSFKTYYFQTKRGQVAVAGLGNLPWAMGYIKRKTLTKVKLKSTGLAAKYSTARVYDVWELSGPKLIKKAEIKKQSKPVIL